MDKLFNLPLKKDSISKVESFISVATNQDELVNASFFLCKIYEHLEMYDEAVTKLLELLNEEIKKKYPYVYQDVLDMLIRIYSSTLNYDDAIKYIFKKRDTLAVFDIYKANLMLIDIYLSQGKMVEAITLCESVLKEDLSDNEKYETYKKLIRIYLEDKEYDIALKYVRYLKESSYGLDENNYYYALYYEAYATYMVKEYQTSSKMLKECLENRMFFDNELLVRIYVLDLKIHIALKEYKRAVVNEAEYEPDVLNSSDDVQNDFFDACIELYTNLENKLSLEMYQERKRKIKDKKQKKSITVKKVIKEIKEVKSEVVKKELTYKDDNKGIYHVIESMIKIQEATLNNKIVPKFRDILLPLLIVANKEIPFDEAIIYNVDNKCDSYYFKKERLYEKTFNIRNTVIYDVLNSNTEMLYPLKSDLKGKIDLITNQVYEYTDVSCLMAFPIIDKEIKAVCLFYAFSEKLINGFNYELLRFVCSLISDRMLNHQQIKDLRIENNMFANAFNYIDIPIKYMINKTVYLNNQARMLCKLPEKMDISEFMLSIKADDYQAYRNFLSDDSKEVTYHFNDIVLLEKANKVIKDDKIIISTLFDDSVKELNEQHENEMLYIDYLTRLKNRHAFEKDIMDVIRDEKFSMLMLDINYFKKINDCYGVNYGDTVLRSTAFYLKEFFKTDMLYHFNADEFLVIISGNNDARSISNISHDLLEYLRLHVNKKSTRFEVTYSVGALRYKVQTLEHDPSKLLEYVNFALLEAKMQADHFSYFNQEKYRESFNMTSLVAHINEAIDLSKIGVKYYQVINVEKSMISYYEIKPYVLDLNVSSSEIMRVVNLRGLTVKLERFLIRKTIKEILFIFEKKKKYVRISLSLNYDTLLSDGFIPFMEKLYETYKLPNGLILFDIYGKKKDISGVVDKLRNLGVCLITSKIEDALLYNIDFFKVDYLLPHLESAKGKNTARALVSMCDELNAKLIVTNVQAKDLDVLKECKVAYASYEKELTMDELMKKMG